MNLLDNSILAYTTFDNALKEIEDKVKWVQSDNVAYFLNKQQDDNHLSSYVNSVSELRKTMSTFNNLFEDLMMEVETAEQLKWEDEHKQAEQDYYSEVQNEGLNL